MIVAQLCVTPNGHRSVSAQFYGGLMLVRLWLRLLGLPITSGRFCNHHIQIFIWVARSMHSCSFKNPFPKVFDPLYNASAHLRSIPYNVSRFTQDTLFYELAPPSCSMGVISVNCITRLLRKFNHSGDLAFTVVKDIAMWHPDVSFSLFLGEDSIFVSR